MTRVTDAAIERVAERWGSASTYYCRTEKGYVELPEFTRECDREQSLSDALRAHFGDEVPASLAGYVLPVVVDPIVQMVREAMAERYGTARCEKVSAAIREGKYDDYPWFIGALSVARAIAAQGGEA